ncbi:MAG: YraN family protein [bacterium]
MKPRAAARGSTGAAGESLAAAWLAARGYRIETRNFRCRTGEIDVVASRNGLLVFVEVKTRRSGAFGAPAEAVGAAKRARLLRAASLYLARFGSRPPACRFDVMEVRAAPGASPEVRHLPDAFRSGWI